jgi:hypothetical protein
MKNHEWEYVYFNFQAKTAAWICKNCKTHYYGPMKPRGASFYRKIGILADCQAQMVLKIMES